MKKRFDDRIIRFPLSPKAPGDSPGVSSIEPAPDGWKLTRRSLMGLVAAGAFAGYSKADGAATCPVGAFAHEISLDSLSFLPGGKTLVSAGLDGFLKFWTIPDGALFRVATTDAIPLQVAASPDGTWIAVAMEGGALELWPAGAGTHRTWTGHSDAVEGVAFSPDSGRLVSVSLDRTTKVWSVADASVLQSFDDTTDIMARVAVPRGDYLVTAGVQVYLRSLSTGAILKSVPGKAFAVSPDGKYLAAQDGTRLYMYAFPSLNQIVSVVDKQNAASLSFSDDGKLLAIAYTDAPAKLYYAPGLTLKCQMEANEGPCLSTSTVRAALPAAQSAPIAAPRPGKVPAAIPPPRNGCLAVASGKSIRLYTLPSGDRMPVCFMDLAASSPSVSGTEYIVNGVVYTISCGARIPSGLECTCNCVPGNCPCVDDTGCSCVSDAGCDCVSDVGCSCDSDTGCGCVGDIGCSCDSDYGCGCVDDTGCSCDSDTGCGCVGDSGCSCDSDTGCGCVDDSGCSCDSDMGCGCVDD
jgi:WD40 repeat protein